MNTNEKVKDLFVKIYKNIYKSWVQWMRKYSICGHTLEECIVSVARKMVDEVSR